MPAPIVWIVGGAVALIILAATLQSIFGIIQVVPRNHEMVIERWGQPCRTIGEGWKWIIPAVEWPKKIQFKVPYETTSIAGILERREELAESKTWPIDEATLPLITTQVTTHDSRLYKVKGSLVYKVNDLKVAAYKTDLFGFIQDHISTAFLEIFSKQNSNEMGSKIIENILSSRMGTQEEKKIFKKRGIEFVSVNITHLDPGSSVALPRRGGGTTTEDPYNRLGASTPVNTEDDLKREMARLELAEKLLTKDHDLMLKQLDHELMLEEKRNAVRLNYMKAQLSIFSSAMRDGGTEATTIAFMQYVAVRQPESEVMQAPLNDNNTNEFQ